MESKLKLLKAVKDKLIELGYIDDNSMEVCSNLNNLLHLSLSYLARFTINNDYYINVFLTQKWCSNTFACSLEIVDVNDLNIVYCPLTDNIFDVELN